MRRLNATSKGVISKLLMNNSAIKGELPMAVQCPQLSCLMATFLYFFANH